MNPMPNAPLTVNAALRASLHDENRAIYLPAISKGFASFAVNGELAGSDLPFKAQDLNFLDPNNKFFHYPYALYSAGQSNTATAPAIDMVSQRDRSATLVLGDSGGYQVSTKKGYFSQALVLRNMRWMEAIADYSMVLDFPTGGIGPGNMTDHVTRLNLNGELSKLAQANGLGLDYNACLEQTKLNNDDFVANHAPGATAFLNVLQGRSEKESKYWYEAVKHYPFAGWSFAGHHQNRFSLMLARMIDMRDDNLLASIQWVHVLGVSTLPIGILLTTVQRTIRQHYNPNFQMSFDTASPFLMGANRQMVAAATMDERGWTFQHVAPTVWPASADSELLTKLIGDEIATLDARQKRDRSAAITAVSGWLRLADIRKPDPDDCSKFKFSSDGDNLVMHHNVEAYVNAHQIAHETWFEPHGAGRLRNHFVAKDIRIIAAFIEAVLLQPTVEAKAMIRENAHHLDSLR